MAIATSYQTALTSRHDRPTAPVSPVATAEMRSERRYLRVAVAVREVRLIGQVDQVPAPGLREDVFADVRHVRLLRQHAKGGHR